jgi:hypothetical protein
MNVVRIGFYRSFEFLANQRVCLVPIRLILTSRDVGFDLFSRIAHGIAFLPHVGLSLLSQSVSLRLERPYDGEELSIYGANTHEPLFGTAWSGDRRKRTAVEQGEGKAEKIDPLG